MSVANPENIERPKTILPGDKVIVVESSSVDFFHESLFGESERNTDTSLEIFQGIVKTIPEQAADHKGFWEIKDVEGINLGTGAVRRCVNLSFDSDDMSFNISRISPDTPKDQLYFRIDHEGVLQL